MGSGASTKADSPDTMGEYAKSIAAFNEFSTGYPIYRDKFDVEIQYVNTNDKSTNKKETFTIEAKSQVMGVKAYVCDFTDEKFEMPDGLDEEFAAELRPEPLKIGVCIMDKTKPQSAEAMMALFPMLEHFDLCLIFNPAMKEKASEVMSTIFKRPEFLNFSFLKHLILFPRIKFYDVHFDLNDFKDQKVINGAYFGNDESITLPEGNECAKEMTKYYSRVHWFVGKYDPDKLFASDLLPKWQSFMKCPSEKSFFLVATETTVKWEFAETPADADEEMKMECKEIGMNLEDLNSEYTQYATAGEEEDEE